MTLTLSVDLLLKQAIDVGPEDEEQIVQPSGPLVDLLIRVQLDQL